MKNSHKSINPYTGDDIKKYAHLTNGEINITINNAKAASKIWQEESLKNKCQLLKKVAEHLEHNKQEFAKLITREMGKPITESIAEIEKCILLCHFYQVNAKDFLADALIETDAQESFISHDPLGCILGIMPWNYPFWQVLRFAIPTLTAGNVILLKHASNVTGCALAIEKLFKDSGYPKNVYQNLITSHDEIENIISNDVIKAVSLTGSEKAGRKVAEIAGKNLKKAVLELGGTNACIVLEDADLEKHIDTMVKARYQNNGQSCIAAKRFIVVDSIYDTFLDLFTKHVSNLTIGNPKHENTEISVLAKREYTKSLSEQVKESTKLGAKIHYGNEAKDAYYQPTIITNVTPEMSLFKEEVFGPIASIIRAKDTDDAFELNAMTNFGLGTMLFSQDTAKIKRSIIRIEDGAFFVNDMVKSDPRLPFGGTKNSGYGRELSKEGILEFVNKKTVYIKK